MSPDLEMVKRHLRSLLAEAGEAQVPSDVVGRLLVQEAIEIWKQERGVADISGELEFIAGHLDPDTDFEFMRP
jgi:hypothetical protein